MPSSPVGESATESAPAFTAVAKLADLPEGKQLSLYVGLKRILLCRSGAEVFAVRDMCPHALQPLLGSAIENNVIKCSKHGATFDLATGCPANGVTSSQLEVYPVNLRDETIEVAVK